MGCQHKLLPGQDNAFWVASHATWLPLAAAMPGQDPRGTTIAPLLPRDAPCSRVPRKAAAAEEQEQALPSGHEEEYPQHRYPAQPSCLSGCVAENPSWVLGEKSLAWMLEKPALPLDMKWSGLDLSAPIAFFVTLGL